MRKRIPIKNHHQEVQLITQRSMLGLLIICILIFLLIFRLAYLQIYKNDVYTTLATRNWLDLVPVEPTRGLIYDRNGVLLADNIPVFSLDITPVQVNNLNETLASLRRIVSLTDSDLTQFQRQLKQHRRFDEIPLKLRLTEDEVARFTENQHLFPGVSVKARLMRRYPYGKSFSHLLGYVGRINAQELNEIDAINYSASHYIGKLGVEKFYEEELHGSVGYEEVENDASGKPLRTLKETLSVPGKNIYLTIDSRLQFVAEQALAGHRGAIVAIKPENGQILALVSEPGYDPNLFVTGISQTDYQALQQAEDRPLFNRALRGLYPPASTIKPLLALNGLELGLITKDDAILDSGVFQLANNTHRYHDWRRGGHGTVDVYKAIASSCDIYFYQLAVKVGIRRMDDILARFGLGAPTGIDLEEELAGTLPSPEWKRKMRHAHWYQGDTVITGIGQGSLQTTPLQLAAAVATVANRGGRFMPYVLLGEQLPGGRYQPQQPIPLESVNAKAENWEMVIQGMQEVLNAPYGSGYPLWHRPVGYSIAGKTGTAQIVRRSNPEHEDNQANLQEKFRDHHLFIAFAPVDKPVLAVAVITENSSAAVAAARMIFDYYLGKQKNVNRQLEVQAQETRP